jgi:hypothetical protein
MTMCKDMDSLADNAKHTLSITLRAACPHYTLVTKELLSALPLRISERQCQGCFGQSGAGDPRHMGSVSVVPQAFSSSRLRPSLAK